MKIIVIFSVLCFQLQVNAKAQFVSISVENTSLKEVFKQLRKQTGFGFLYKETDLAGTSPVSLSFKNKELKEVLNKCLNNQPLTYSIERNFVVIKRKILQSNNTINQTIHITGKIIDEKGEPLPGVNVRVKNQQISTVSDVNGNYKINVPSQAAILVFSYIGFTTLERKVEDNKIINIKLAQDVSKLDEIVVVGYGEVKRGDLTGSVGIVKVEQLEVAPVMSFDQALAGRIAGVQVSSSDGQPGSEGVSVVIRGAGSLTQDVSPLYVVDGFPNEHFDPGSLNTDDIESINILKDASAIAIYGARASNGVVVIETKKGKVGKPAISYSGSFGIQEVTNQMEMMNPYEFVRFQDEKGFGAGYLIDGRTVDDYKNIKGINWQDKILKTGMTNINSISVSGGNGGTRYLVSGSIFNNDAIIVNTGQDRYQGRFTLTQEINKKITSGLTLNYSQRSFFGSQAAASGGSASVVSSYLFYSVLGYRPVTGRIDFSEEDLESSLVDDDVDVINDYRVNPFIDVSNEYDKRVMKNMQTNAYINYKINRKLTFRAQGSLDSYNTNREYFYNSNTRRGNSLLPGNARGQWGGKLYDERFTWSNENTLTYKNVFNKKHTLEGLLGYSMQQSQSTNSSFVGANVPDEAKGIDGLGNGEASTIGGRSSEYRMMSYFGRANYNYRSRFFLTATFRADGSSRFAPGNQWGYFPSGAFAWRMSKEKFMKNIKAIYDAKLRISYGHTGNNRVSDYAYVDLINYSQPLASYSWGGAAPTLGAYMTSLGNPDLKWETTEAFDIGYDLSLFKNKIEIVFDYYTRTTRDLLLNANMPTNTGYARAFKNIGSLRNSGIEFTINTINFSNKKFKWETNFNISFNKNKVLKLTDGENIWLQNVAWNSAYTSTDLYLSQVGQPAGQMFGFIWDGNYQYDDFVDNTYTALKPGVPYNNPERSAVEPGEIKYRDLNGDGIIDDNDKTIIGRGTPIHSGGFHNSFTYKGLRLGVLFQWTYGNDILHANSIVFEGGTAGNLNQFASYANRWTPDNQTNENFKVLGYGPQGRYSTKYVEDGSFLRLKTVDLSYRLPVKWYTKHKIRSIALTAAAQNLYVWSNYPGFDPEVSTRPSVLTPGFDFSAYPRALTFVAGIRVGF